MITMNNLIAIVNQELEHKTPLNEIGKIPVYCIINGEVVELNSVNLWVDNDGKCIILSTKA